MALHVGEWHEIVVFPICDWTWRRNNGQAKQGREQWNRWSESGAALNALLSLEISSGQDVSICCVGTDGIDGNSTGAGALITTTMVGRDKPDIMEDLRRHLENHDSIRHLRCWVPK